jgi:hypothetical protein
METTPALKIITTLKVVLCFLKARITLKNILKQRYSQLQRRRCRRLERFSIYNEIFLFSKRSRIFVAL